MFKNLFRKRQEEPKESREVETAVVIVMNAEGGSTIPILKVEGIKKRRDATMNDLYRMVCDVKAQIEEIRLGDNVLHTMIKMHQVKSAEPAEKETQKPLEEKKNDGNEVGNSETPKVP